ncbi:dUTP diphosphatase [Candidatus Desulforudis audaxviator]|uniref:Deoxyuridine 5'-triphosphate nucleotidohydrolase n=1 Tax=Desulforudis audaxviator (strain MP104C) TaxID=477974 RepID=B1I396_DESAP|nr:dUTP diphosphatase [Candidatus Desulforudis audaxviator]ACA59450.1 deoxyuridine 5'-triphosphate nucleotidohydrolase Dut [Candidatus Desulforudis audaxviator MP104C]AZK59432.1 Deoxyuridine 5'-triphosphate nucleotidohydrolase [Candidatus Desulforudis audaxviator]
MAEVTRIVLRVKKLNPTIGKSWPGPAYATSGAAGLDLCAALDSSLTIAPGERVQIPTGIAVQLPERNLVGLVFGRSGLAARHGITLANGVGVIDADYTGEIICPVVNHGTEPFTLSPGDRIAQLVCVPIAVAEVEYVFELAETARGAGGFGSTGK